MKRYFGYLKHNHKGQNTTEYVVILALVIGMIVLFFPKIRTAVENKSLKIADTITTGKE